MNNTPNTTQLSIPIRACSNRKLLELCSSDKIEATLGNLRKLDIWISAKIERDRPSEDITGLTRIKAETLHASCSNGFVRPVSYLDGISRFEPFPAGRLYLSESFFELLDPRFLERFPGCSEALSEVVEHAARFLGRNITIADLSDATFSQQIAAQIDHAHKEYLSVLEERARQTRKPIPFREVERFLFDTEEHEYGAERLDPEHSSSVGFSYESETAQFIFNLPFRYAELFLADHDIRSLPTKEIRSYGIISGQEITVEEALRSNLIELINRLGNYHMDSLVLAVFESELLRQCSFGMLALQDIEEFLAYTSDYRLADQTRFWFSVHALLSAVANISKILWPSKTASEIGKARGNKLRKILKVDNDSPLKARTLRNHFEHWDERMDKRAATLDATENRWILDGEIYSAPSAEFENPAYTLRNFDATRFVVTFQEDSFELEPIKRALDQLQETVTEAFRRVPYCM